MQYKMLRKYIFKANLKLLLGDISPNPSKESQFKILIAVGLFLRTSVSFGFQLLTLSCCLAI